MISKLIVFLLAAAFANAASVQFVGVPTGVNDGQYYDLPYQINLDGKPLLVTCYDIYDDVTFGDAWQANVLTLSQASISGFFSANPSALAKYERVAWLDSQTYSTTAQQIGLQYAIWDVFGTARSSPEEQAYQAAANAAALSGYAGFDFSNVRFIEQIGGVVGANGTKQAFVFWQAPPNVQLANATTSPVPEPGTITLLLLGLAASGLFLSRRRTACRVRRDSRNPPVVSEKRPSIC